MNWSPQQDGALKAVNRWLRSRSAPQTFYLAGYAGTGKTTLARHLAEGVDGEVLFGAFTGKASLVLQTKGCANASTLHSMIYRLEDEDAPEPRFVLNRDSPVRGARLVVVDEVSMVDQELGQDLLSFGTKVLVLGDPFQLPPVKGEGYFTAGKPDVLLTEVHRQAAENPIIAMSMTVRTGGRLVVGEYGTSRVIERRHLTQGDVRRAGQVIVGLNKTRRTFNQKIRRLLGREGWFRAGDRVISLRNNRDKGLLNGAIWNVSRVEQQDSEQTRMIVAPLDAGMIVRDADVTTHHAWVQGTERELPAKFARQFDPFDFAYAITCHKSQGSQWDDVVVVDESSAFEESARWVYTALTRAAERVTVVIQDGRR